MKNRVHFIEQDLRDFDLQLSVWALMGLWRLEVLLSRYARFEDQYGA